MKKKALITGGAGFIGINLASYLLDEGWYVTILDNLSRKGTQHNLSWIKKHARTGRLKICITDIRNYDEVKNVVSQSDVIYHLAGQVAVTTSYLRPREDFDINLLGTMNILEAARESGHKPIMLFASTNKVYGGLDEILVKESAKRYVFADSQFGGVSESQLLDFHSPYGCSKGAADQYTRDYYRMYDIPTVVFRQSCIYGPRQMGMEDQGWVAHLAAKTLFNEPISIYGNGKQVRDLLHVNDLIAAYQTAVEHIEKAKGKIYNIGGGKEHAFSLLEYVRFLEEIIGKKIDMRFEHPRPGDQKIYISDTKKIENDLSWTPKICHREGLKQLHQWVSNSLDLFTPQRNYVDAIVAVLDKSALLSMEKAKI